MKPKKKEIGLLMTKEQEIKRVICCITGCKKPATSLLGNNLYEGKIPFCEKHIKLFEQHNLARENSFREQGKAQALKQVMEIIEKLEKDMDKYSPNGYKWLGLANQHSILQELLAKINSEKTA